MKKRMLAVVAAVLAITAVFGAAGCSDDALSLIHI